MIAWPEDLVRDIARRRCVIFLGAGVSKNSQNANGERPSDWREFLEVLAQELPAGEARDSMSDCIASLDLLTACEIGYKNLHRERFRTVLLREFSEKRFQPAQIHEELVRIDSRIVVTTNFDKIFETYASAALHGDILIKKYDDDDVADIVRRSNRCVLKIHGTIDVPSGAILTRSDYARARVKYHNFYRIVDALFATHTFLFLGASMSDPDIRLVLEDYTNRYEYARPHYFVAPSGHLSDSELRVVEESMSVRAITYSDHDYHRELMEGVTQLREQVELERQELTRNMNW